MTQTILNIALAACVGVLAWKLRKERKIKEFNEWYRRDSETTNSLIGNIFVYKSIASNHVEVVDEDACFSVRIYRAAKKDNHTVSSCYVIKLFPYNPSDASDHDYARLCAEELKEAIEYDWRIKEVER